jgi:hypothetical protein
MSSAFSQKTGFKNFMQAETGLGKIIDFTKIAWGEEFTFEAPLRGVKGTITGQGSLRSGDYVILCINCCVEKVEPQVNTPTAWKAKISFGVPMSVDSI